MPFDSLPMPAVTNPDVELLDKTIALLSERRRWTKGCSIRTHSDGVRAYCLMGAAYEVGRMEVRLTQLLHPLLPPGCLGVTDWNDAPERKHDEVLALLRCARERALRGS